MSKTPGLHHITAFASDPARNADFYQRVLGLRMIKQTVNYDDPSVYHLYYGDNAGNPGTVITFFPRPGVKSGTRGAAEAAETAFSVPEGSISFWKKRFEHFNVQHGGSDHRFGEVFLPFTDPDGMSLALVEQAKADGVSGEIRGDISAARAIRGFSGITLHSAKPESTAAVLSLMGYRQKLSEGRLTRWSAGAGGQAKDIDVKDCSNDALHSAGAGSVHHVAFAAVDDASQAEMAAKMSALGLAVTEQRDRTYFRSVYFREPGGVLIEIATNEPGFAVDESEDHLGEKLMLPLRLEPRRAEIVAALPPLTVQRSL
jgi:glyoxalase family protein